MFGHYSKAPILFSMDSLWVSESQVMMRRSLSYERAARERGVLEQDATLPNSRDEKNKETNTECNCEAQCQDTSMSGGIGERMGDTTISFAVSSFTADAA